MKSKTATLKQYLEGLPEDRREAISAVREVILSNLPEGFRESFHFGMITYCVPHNIYPHGYHCDVTQPVPYIMLASQKNYVAIYLFCLYLEDDAVEKFKDDYLKTGKKLDMGKSCLRFKKLDDIPLELIGQVAGRMSVDEFITLYESRLSEAERKKRSKVPTL